MSEPGSEYGRRVVDALLGLVPIAWIDRCGRAADPLRPRRDELWPTDAEREGLLERIVVADGLAAGCPSTRPGSLAAVAKALAILALAPGGVRFLGHRWFVEDAPDGAALLRDEPWRGWGGAPAAEPWDALRRLTEVVEVARRRKP